MKQKNLRLQQKVADLEFKLKAALAGQAHVYYHAEHSLKRLGTDKSTLSGVVVTMHLLSGEVALSPVLILDGLSDATIAALKADFARSYKMAVAFKPSGAKDEVKQEVKNET